MVWYAPLWRRMPDVRQAMCGWSLLIRTSRANADSLPVPLLVTIKFRGSVSDVEAAMEAGERVARSLTGVVQKHIIPRPTEDTEKMLKLCAFDKS